MNITIMQVVFFVIAAISLYAALNVVSTNNLVHSALWLILALFGIGGVYVLLNAGFFAVAQVLIYIGAIAILFIFAVMLTRNVADEATDQTNANWKFVAIIPAAFFGGIVYVFRASQWQPFFSSPPELPAEAGTLSQLGLALVGDYLVPFEIASVLLVAAMIGAVYVAWGKQYSPETKED